MAQTTTTRFAIALCAFTASVAKAEPHPDDFVDVTTAIPDAVLDLRYASTDNFTGEKLYTHATCKLRRVVAEKLADAAKRLRAQHRRLLLWDCYRPSSVQQILWQHNPDPRFVADPKVGSVHSRGAAVDVGLVDSDGAPVVLPTAYDAATRDAFRDRALDGQHGAEARTLEAAMTAAGFVGLATEWWHFDLKSGKQFPLADDPL